jgi:hypothetical protein
VHVKKAGDTVASKSVVLFYPKPARCYTDTAAFDGVDLSNTDIGNGEPVTAVQEAKYLGSYATQAGTDLRDVEERILKASQAFGALKHCLFRQRDIATEAKRSVYCGLILAILLFGAEHWCLTAKMVRMLRAFHHRCMRSMYVPTEPLAHTPQPRQDFDPRHQTRHPDHRDLHCTTAAAMAWSRVADARDAAAKDSFDSLATAKEASG